jgi:hypothetical protein
MDICLVLFITLSENRFDPLGVLVLSITRYRLQLAQEAFGQVVSAKDGDFAWDTFLPECFALAKSIAARHHRGKSDSFRLATLNKQATHVVQWLSSGRGMESTYCFVFFCVSLSMIYAKI